MLAPANYDALSVSCVWSSIIPTNSTSEEKIISISPLIFKLKIEIQITYVLFRL